MYEMDIFDIVKMPLDWAMIYYGINNNIFSIDIAQEFVCRKLAHNEKLLEEELELSWNINERLEVLELIERILCNQGDMYECVAKAKEKIRIALIIYLRKTEKNVVKLLEQIAVIYSDFGYPKDMDEFITYMPTSDEYDATKHTLTDNRRYLLSKLDYFIEEQIIKYKLKMEI